MTLREKLNILETTLSLLGPDGEQWMQGSYYGYGSSDYVVQTVFGSNTPEEVLNGANRWCLVGAVAESAYRLGYTDSRHGDTADRLAEETSLNSIARSEEYPSAIDLNDAPETEFEEVRRLLVRRIDALKAANG